MYSLILFFLGLLCPLFTDERVGFSRLTLGAEHNCLYNSDAINHPCKLSDFKEYCRIGVFPPSTFTVNIKSCCVISFCATYRFKISSTSFLFCSTTNLPYNFGALQPVQTAASPEKFNPSTPLLLTIRPASRGTVADTPFEKKWIQVLKELPWLRNRKKYLKYFKLKDVKFQTKRFLFILKMKKTIGEI